MKSSSLRRDFVQGAHSAGSWIFLAYPLIQAPERGHGSWSFTGSLDQDMTSKMIPRSISPELPVSRLSHWLRSNGYLIYNSIFLAFLLNCSQVELQLSQEYNSRRVFHQDPQGLDVGGWYVFRPLPHPFRSIIWTQIPILSWFFY